MFNLKEIEKWGSKRGVGKWLLLCRGINKFVVLQTIKDINQSLVDDNLVETDKLGAGAFFWALPSKGYQSRQNLISNVSHHIEQVEQEIIALNEKLAHEREIRKSSDGGREEKLSELH